MMANAADVADDAPFGRYYKLPRMIAAIQLLPDDETGSKRLGLLTQLPEGAEIEVGGPGFNPETLQVRCGAASYFVFSSDLEAVRKRVGAASA